MSDEAARGDHRVEPGDRRGVLYPKRLPEFHRLEPPADLAHVVRWFWIPEWNLPEGVESRQEILPFPACNLVVEPSGVTVVGPPTRRSERVLTGEGWAVGALLRAAATPMFISKPAALRDASTPLAAQELHAEVAAAMLDTRSSGAMRRAGAVDRFGAWLRNRLLSASPDEDGTIANELETLLAKPEITRVDQLPPMLHVSLRTLQRIAGRHFGVSLHSMIRRRRLQEAAERLRNEHALSISALATDLGYSDHAHFAKDFKSQLGLSPSAYRADVSSESVSQPGRPPAS